MLPRQCCCTLTRLRPPALPPCCLPVTASPPWHTRTQHSIRTLVTTRFKPHSKRVRAARCLDQYFELRLKQVEQKEDVAIDGRLVAIVERMLDK